MENEKVEDVNTVSTATNEATKEEKKISTIIYILQALGFLTGVTWIAAVIMSYGKKADYKGTWLESHIKWQIRTFWWGLLWMVVAIVGAFFAIGIIVGLVTTVWLIYRVVKGWLRLNDGKEMYA